MSGYFTAMSSAEVLTELATLIRAIRTRIVVDLAKSVFEGRPGSNSSRLAPSGL
jgi:hypothetical protein